MTKFIIGNNVKRLALATTIVAGCSLCSVSSADEWLYQNPNNFLPAVPTSYPDDPACKVKSIQKTPASPFQDPIVSAATGLVAATQLDTNGIFQLYVGGASSNSFKCITCTPVPGGPAVNRNKTSDISWHPSGRWLVVGVEETTHDLMWLPEAWQRQWLNSGIWLNIWITTPTGDRWYQITNYNPSSGNPANGFTGVAFTPDGKKGVWAEFVGASFTAAFGIWKLYIADFVVDAKGTPSFINKRDITPAGATWLEPGNFSPDGRHILLSTDIGLTDAEGQDQWSLDVFAGQPKQLTNTPTAWDEHGLYSPDGRKIVWMSSYPYRNDPNSYKVLSLHTEFMLMNADGSEIQQLIRGPAD